MSKCVALLVVICIIFGCESKESRYGNYRCDELRFYAGAPPLIPHDVINRDCLDCHETGLQVEGFVAVKTPHPQLQNCQQCHVRANEAFGVFVANDFQGLQQIESLPLTQPYAPPLIPHPVFMHEECLVCHDDTSRTDIIQTTHPERLNCTQCHISQGGLVAATDGIK